MNSNYDDTLKKGEHRGPIIRFPGRNFRGELWQERIKRGNALEDTVRRIHLKYLGILCNRDSTKFL